MRWQHPCEVTGWLLSCPLIEERLRLSKADFPQVTELEDVKLGPKPQVVQIPGHSALQRHLLGHH